MTEADKSITGLEAVQRAKEQLQQVTGFHAETVSLLRYEQPFWFVGVEMLEVSRVPQTTDILGSYLVQLDQQGRLVEYRRTRRYPRSQVLECTE